MTIEQKIKEIDKKIISMLRESTRQLDYLGTWHNPNGLAEDGTSLEVFSSTVREPIFNKLCAIITHAETLQVLYVQTGPTSLVDLYTFLGLEKEN